MRTTSLKCGEFTFQLEIRDSPANPVIDGLWFTNSGFYFDDVELERFACAHFQHKKFTGNSFGDDRNRTWALTKAAEIIDQFKQYKALRSSRSAMHHDVAWSVDSSHGQHL